MGGTQGLSLLLLLQLIRPAALEAVTAEACRSVSPDTEPSGCSLEVTPSSSAVLLQRLQQPTGVTAPSEDTQKFFGGVPVYNYGYVRWLKQCEKVGGSGCKRGLLQTNNGQAHRAPVKGLKKDWEEDFLHNDDDWTWEMAAASNDKPDDDGEEADPYMPPTRLEDPPKRKHSEPDSVREWLVKMRDGVTDQVLFEFCERMPGKAKCTAQGHPSEGGIPMAIVRSTEEELEEHIRSNPAKSEYVEPDIPMDAIPEVKSKEEESNEKEIAGDDEKEPFSWGLDRIDDRHGTDGSYDIGLEGGKGVHVYVADTGIRTTHQDFHGRAIPTLEIRRGILRECEPHNHRCAQDTSGHGTHAASTVGGKSYGVAKSSTLHSIKILSDAGHGKMSYLIQALDWVATKGERPAVFMASISGRGNPRPVAQAIEAASAAGITVVVAAGNHGRDACEFSPAHVKAAITVGATQDADDTIASYSNFGRCVDLYAPGSNVHSAGSMSDTAKATMSGTSMSTPHVAGAAALLLGEDTSRTPDGIALLIKARATQSSGKDKPGGVAHMMLYTADLDESDEIWWQSVWLPTWRKMVWSDMFHTGPMKELLAEGTVCCLFLITLGFMMTQCIRFFSLPPDAYERCG